MQPIGISWSALKNFLTERKTIVQYLDVDDQYILVALDGIFSVSCVLKKDGGADVSEFEADFKPSANQSPQSQVTTLFEKNDKDLKICSVSVPVDVETGEASIEIMSPAPGRWLDSGHAFFTAVEPKRVKLIEGLAGFDIPADALGPGSPPLPAGTVLKTYHDEELPEEQQGWRVPGRADYGPVGEVIAETLAGYGWVPGGIVLKINASIPGSAPFSGWFTVNFKWGKPS